MTSPRGGQGAARAALRRSALPACAAAALLLPATAPAQLDKPAAGEELSPRLDALAAPALAGASPGRQARELDLPARGPGSLQRDGDAVVVEVLVDDRASRAADALAAAGADVVDVSAAYRTISAYVEPEALRAVAAVPGVESVAEAPAPIVWADGPGGDGAVTNAECGSVNSEGDQHLKADIARSQLGISGSGVEVGVLSDTYDKDATATTRATQDVASGDLPGVGNPCGKTTPVDVIDDTATGKDEGRAMLQHVHDLAPDAALSFATAFPTDTAFAGNIRDLRDAGADVIVDDVTYFSEPFYQDGPVSVAVNDVTASGVTHFSSAGNSNIIAGGNNVASWEAPSFRPTGSCPSGIVGLPATADDCLDFDPAAGVDQRFDLTIPAGRKLTMILQYAQPWFGVDTDIDMYLVDDTTNAVVASSTQNNPGTSQKPFEFFNHTNSSASAQDVSLIVDRFSGTATPRTKWIALGGGALSASEYPVSANGDVVGPTIFGHNGAENAMSTAAVRYDTTTAPETFSSRGPVTLLFGPVNGTTPAAPLGSPQVLTKPDISATDGARNTFFLPPSNRFFGTSAAAPHAGAVAALQLDAEPSAGPAEIESAQKDTADPVGSYPATAVGAGLLNAVEAAGGTDPGPPAPPPPPATGGGAAADTQPPDTQIVDAPRSRSKSKSASFTFISTEPVSSFECKLDRGGFGPCASPRSIKVGKGAHSFQVRAIDAAGNTDATPAARSWTVKKKKKK